MTRPAFLELVGGRHDGARVSYQGAEVVITHIGPPVRVAGQSGITQTKITHFYDLDGERYVLGEVMVETQRIDRDRPARDPRCR